MPGPILRMAASSGDSNDFSVFESCDDIQEAWGGLNGNFSAESVYHDCRAHFSQEYCEARVNGEQTVPASVRSKASHAMAEARQHNNNVRRERVVVEVQGARATQADEFGEAMDVEEEAEEAVETVNLPVVSASLSVDLSKSLTRQKITSVQRGPTLTYADHDDSEEPPTRRPRPLAHPSESMDVGTPLHCRPASPSSLSSLGSPVSPSSPVSPGSPSSAGSPISVRSSPGSSQRSTRISRNPSYHYAVRDASVGSPQLTTKVDKSSRSCDSSPIRPALKPLMEESPREGAGGGGGGGSGRRHASESDGFISVPIASNMPRSVSFSGQELLSPAAGASGSLSEGNSRSGSVPHLSVATSTHRSAPTLDTKSSPPNFTRGSVISRSFRRLFSTPSRPPPAIQTEECWDDVPGVPSTSEGENKSSRLKRISHSFSRKLSAKPKMSASGTNGQHIVVPNGSTTPEDPGSLVEYEDLLKLFCCSGCQSFMAPPLHQCRKGHLVCNSCRFSLKQACPTCKQRFAESTNMMMEQVCQLVKFPCKYSPQGCPEFHRPRAKQDHEHFCSYRPVHCHHGPQGCPKVLLLRDMPQHLETCEYKKK